MGRRSGVSWGERVDLILRGHLHEPEVSEWADPDRRLRQSAAGCLYEGGRADQWPNACTVLEMDLDDAGRPERIALRFRGWEPPERLLVGRSDLYRQSRNGWAVWQVRPRTGPPEVAERVTQLFVGRREDWAPRRAGAARVGRRPAGGGLCRGGHARSGQVLSGGPLRP